LNNIGCYQCFNRYPTNAPCVDNNWVTVNDSVMSDDGESDE